MRLRLALPLLDITTTALLAVVAGAADNGKARSNLIDVEAVESSQAAISVVRPVVCITPSALLLDGERVTIPDIVNHNIRAVVVTADDRFYNEKFLPVIHALGNAEISVGLGENRP